MTTLPPWANGPFELLLHAEGHRLQGEDFDRRIALISFDNAIEVAITTYLTLHPIQRGGRTYPKDQVENWLKNYHAKLDFIEHELAARGLTWKVERSHIVWVHDHRNEQYHGGNKGTPEKSVLSLIRDAALWIFSVLFEIPAPEAVLEDALIVAAPPAPPERDNGFDTAIDDTYGLIKIGEGRYYASDIVFAMDEIAYRTLGQRLAEGGLDDDEAGGAPEE